MFKKTMTILIVIVLLLSNAVKAATKEDVIGAINATYTVGNETYRLPQSAINKGISFLNSREFTPQQYDKMLGLIGSAVSLARQAGTTDITKVSKEDLRKGLAIISQASSASNISLSEVTGSLYRNAGKDDSTSNSDKVEYIEKDSEGNTIIRNASGEVAGVRDISGEIHSGEKAYSGEIITYVSGDVESNLSNNSDDEIEKIIDRNTTIAIVIAFVILFILFFIICLLFRSKMNKIVKWFLVIIFVLLFFATLIALCASFYYMEEIKMLYKIYYILK